jgi:hypothetical protein
MFSKDNSGVETAGPLQTSKERLSHSGQRNRTGLICEGTSCCRPTRRRAETQPGLRANQSDYHFEEHPKMD